MQKYMACLINSSFCKSKENIHSFFCANKKEINFKKK